jgi:hypothetical protein
MSSVTKPVDGEFVGHVAAHNAKEKKEFPFNLYRTKVTFAVTQVKV